VYQLQFITLMYNPLDLLQLLISHKLIISHKEKQYAKGSSSWGNQFICTVIAVMMDTSLITDSTVCIRHH